MLSYQTLKKDYPSLNKIIAVSKTKPIEAIQDAIANGFTDFGENKAQELTEKASLITNVTWHFIGHLQRNKVKEVVKHATWIHSVDSSRLIKEIDKETIKQNKEINLLIQINLSHEEQKSGCTLSELPQLIEEVQNCQNCHLKGFMVIGPSSVDLDKTRTIFKQANALLKSYQVQFPELSECSMGMSQDYPIAIEEGSTMVRLGSIIFGQRT